MMTHEPVDIVDLLTGLSWWGRHVTGV